MNTFQLPSNANFKTVSFYTWLLLLALGHFSLCSSSFAADASRAKPFQPIIQHGQVNSLVAPIVSNLHLQGSTATLLPNGKWLLLGGRTPNRLTAVNQARIYDPNARTLTTLTTGLKIARAFHTATLLADGKVLVLGGLGKTGALVDGIELFDPETSLSTVAKLNLKPRANHRATLLVDGNVLVSGGVDAEGMTLSEVVVIDPISNTAQPLSIMLDTPRRNHLSALLPDHQVIIWGGIGKDGEPFHHGQLYQPGESLFHPYDSADTSKLLAELTSHEPPYLIDSVPENGSTNDSVSDPVSVRFSKPLKVASLNRETVVLIGPNGQTPVKVTPVEGGIVAFIKPEEELLPSADYTLIIKGAVDESGQVLPWNTVSFKTQAFNTVLGNTITTDESAENSTGVNPVQSSSLAEINTNAVVMPDPNSTFPTTATNPDSAHAPQTALVAAIADGEAWIPGTEHRRGHWQSDRRFAHSLDTLRQQKDFDNQIKSMSGRARSSVLKRMKATKEVDKQLHYQSLAGNASLSKTRLSAHQNAVTGQVLKLDGKPLANVTLTMGDHKTQSNGRGEFIIKDVAIGEQILVIDGRSANKSSKRYGRFEYRMQVKAGMNALDFTVWMPLLDTSHTMQIPSPTTQEVVVAHPDIPGLEMRIPPGSVIRDAEGKIVTEISLTPIPIDQPPFPVPGFDVPVYFTVQPGGAHIETSHPDVANGARIIYPNYSHELPGARATFWNYDPQGKGWFAYGLGTVSGDGKQVLPDAGVVVHDFTGAMFNAGGTPPTDGPPPSPCPPGPGPTDYDADPVSCRSGLFIESNTDLSVTDTLPLTVARTYRPNDNNNRSFGVGATHNYSVFLWSASQYSQVDLILPDGGRVHYPRTSPGTGWADAVFEYAGPNAKFDGSMIYNASGRWALKLKDGTVMDFPQYSPLAGITDRYGNKTTVMRAGGNSGNITRVVSPNGRWLEYTYDASNRVKTVTDNIGRTVQYDYDVAGQLIKVTNPELGVTEYTYDASHRMLTVKDPRLNQKVLNDYDANGRVSKQTYADNTTTTFAYTLDTNGKVVQTDVTRERGEIRRITYNAAGYQLTDTHALGRPEQQVVSYTLDTSNHMTQMTDALGRVTEYQYDAKGNRTKVTKLFGTAIAIRWLYTYEPTFNQVSTITDPLDHITTFSYDANGNRTQVQDHLGNKVTNSYDAAGRVLTTTRYNGTTPLTITNGYDGGDLVSITDPLNRKTELYPDAVGRIIATKDPLGHYARMEYDNLDRIVKTVDAQGKTESSAYDANSNRLSFTDAKNQTTTFTYDVRNRLTAKQDALLRTESYGYDASGNLIFSTDRRGLVTGYAYDDLNRRTQTGFGATSTTTPTYTSTIVNTYDAANRLTQAVDSANGTITRSYDDRFDSVLEEVTPQGSVDYTYYADGQRQSMTPIGGSTVTYSYDAAKRLTQITQAAGLGGAVPATAQSVGFNYDSANRLTGMTLPNGITATYGYDNASQLLSINYKKADATVIGDLAYSYDNAGQRTTTGGILARTALPTAIASTVHNANNQLTNKDAVAQSYDNNGNLTNDGSRTFTWNDRNQLVAIAGADTASFAYDAFGRRRTATVNGQTTSTLYDGWNPIQLQAGGVAIENRVMGLGLDKVFARTRVGITESYLTDALGSIVELRNAAQAQTVQYTYDPYGNTSASVASTNTIKYTGREQDAADLYYYRNRYFKPSTERFISEDPIGLKGGSNLYAYVGGNPVNLIDPLGLHCCKDAFPDLIPCKDIDYPWGNEGAAISEAFSVFGRGQKRLTTPVDALTGPCSKGGRYITGSHREIFINGEKAGSIVSCKCCQDDGIELKPVTKYKWIPPENIY